MYDKDEALACSFIYISLAKILNLPHYGKSTITSRQSTISFHIFIASIPSYINLIIYYYTCF